MFSSLVAWKKESTCRRDSASPIHLFFSEMTRKEVRLSSAFTAIRIGLIGRTPVRWDPLCHLSFNHESSLGVCELKDLLSEFSPGTPTHPILLPGGLVLARWNSQWNSLPPSSLAGQEKDNQESTPVNRGHSTKLSSLMIEKRGNTTDISFALSIDYITKWAKTEL